MSKSSFKTKIQGFGSFLSSMIMPNMAAFIAWGFLTALFIDVGWIPNEKFAALVDPIIIYAIPLLIAYRGGDLINPKMGGVVGVIATMGAIVGSDQKMLLGAMVLGPLSGWLLKKLQEAYEGHVKSGFEMLVNNFSAGFLALILALLSLTFVAPFMEAVMAVLTYGVDWLVSRGLLPLVHIFVEPGKILFLNNAMNHGIFTPIAADQVAEYGKSLLYMIESNPGPGFGILIAYMLFGKGSEKSTAFGASIVHVAGGIHEIYFPYVLMNPKLIIAAIAGGMTSTFLLGVLNGGLVGAASPGSIFAWLAMTPRGSYFATIVAFLASTAVSTVISSIILKTSKDTGKSLEDAQSDLKKSKSGEEVVVAKVEDAGDLSGVEKIIFACDAGMGSSAMGASILRKKAKEADLPVSVTNTAISQIPADADLVVTHQDLTKRAMEKIPGAIHISVANFMQAPEYDELIGDLKDAKSGKSPSKEESKVDKSKQDKSPSSEILKKDNIILNQSFADKKEAITKVQEILEGSGYVDSGYLEGMLAREEEAPTHFGIGLAIPHGTAATKKEIKKSGLAVITVPQGVNWNGENVKFIVGIAGVGDDHLSILANIANQVNSEEIVNRLVANEDKDEIYEILTKEE